jgi:hypothetical protein
VKFTLKAGKALDERTSYAKVTLRRAKGKGKRKGAACQLLFNIQGGRLGTAISWSKSVR